MKTGHKLRLQVHRLRSEHRGGGQGGLGRGCKASGREGDYIYVPDLVVIEVQYGVCREDYIAGLADEHDKR